MIALRSSVKNPQHKMYPLRTFANMKGGSAANIECASVIMAERPKHVAGNNVLSVSVFVTITFFYKPG
jgi:hypothetical protein